MRLAILMTNTDESDFAQRHPKDGEKFTTFVHLVRPDWDVDVFSVKDGVFPDNIDEFDGVIITGSPTSTRSGAAWIDELLDLIRQMDAQKMPIFGTCFGHQAIALALGGAVDRNPDGWVHGLTQNYFVHRPDWAGDLPETVNLYGSHVEQVSKLPTGAQIVTKSDACTASGFYIGNHIYTTQHHPEMSPGFIDALTDEMQADLGEEMYAQAKASLATTSDQIQFAESVAKFFEQSAAR